MNISIIIPTYNGESRILNTLRALENQTINDFEVIVAIDGSTDNTIELLENQTFSFNDFKIIKQKNKGRAAIRNYGASEASSDLLIFYDDDTRPQKESVERYLEFQKRYESLCGGLAIEDPSLCKTDIQKYKRHLSVKWISKYHEGLNDLKKENLFLTAANFSIPKSIFEKLGGFDESFTDAEDYELGMRALDQGYKVFFDKSNIAWHDDFISCRSYIKRRREYEIVNFQLKKTKSKSILKKILYAPFSLAFWVRLIDKDFFTLFMPLFLRYKLYSMVIWGLSKYYPDSEI